jgi:hypothetical protein
MDTRSFLGVESGWGVMLTPHPLLVPRSKNRVELYLTLPKAFMACKKGETSIFILYLGCALQCHMVVFIWSSAFFKDFIVCYYIV